MVIHIRLDTSEVATDTIDYVATDQNGLTATSTRTIIEAVAARGHGHWFAQSRCG
jgi:hypothetical protein